MTAVNSRTFDSDSNEKKNLNKSTMLYSIVDDDGNNMEPRNKTKQYACMQSAQTVFLIMRPFSFCNLFFSFDYTRQETVVKILQIPLSFRSSCAEVALKADRWLWLYQPLPGVGALSQTDGANNFSSQLASFLISGPTDDIKKFWHSITPPAARHYSITRLVWPAWTLGIG